MSKALHLATDPEAGLKKLLRSLLEGGRVRGVLVLSQVEGGRLAYAMLTDPDRVDESEPLHPLMPVNLGEVLNRFTMDAPSSQPLAVVARPCEIRAFVESVKRRQSHLENLFFISCTCGGVFPTGSEVQGRSGTRLAEYWNGVRCNTVHPDLRTACQSCVEFVPYTADLTLRLVDGTGEFEIIVNGPRGERLIEGLMGEFTDSSLDQDRLSALLEKRRSNREAFWRHAGKRGLEGMVATFGRCIGCHACRNACPICYCDLCTFESNTYEKRPEDYEKELKGKRGTRLPPDTMFFHIGRMMHMAISCVACGSCQDVCPVGIPVAMTFKEVGESLQELFDYVPGKDVGQPVPVSSFEPEEFMRIEDKEVRKN